MGPGVDELSWALLEQSIGRLWGGEKRGMGEVDLSGHIWGSLVLSVAQVWLVDLSLGRFDSTPRVEAVP